MGPNEESRSEIAFFDVETTVPRLGQRHAILEFGAILVCPRKLVELRSYSTFVRPSDVSIISSLSGRCNGITPDAISSAPTFGKIADQVYDILHGRIWAGHNILAFDCARITEAFAEIGRPAPEPKGTIDSLVLLTQSFGRRAGDMKMATLATYFGLGQQTHRSLDDVRMNLEVVKCCAAVLFLEWSLSDTTPANTGLSPSAAIRGPIDGLSSSSSANQKMEENHAIFPLIAEAVAEPAPARTANANLYDMGLLCDEMKAESNQLDTAMEEEKSTFAVAPPPHTFEGSSGSGGFLEPEEVYTSLISASLVPYWGTRRIRLLHNGVVFQLCCKGLRVRYGVISKFVDHAGSPKLNFVADTPPTLCEILEACDRIAQRLSVESGSSSEWKPVVIRKNDFVNSPAVRLHIPTTNADCPRYETEIYRRELSGAVEKLVFNQCDAEELGALINPGTLVDAYFSLDTYDYQANAGIRLVAKKLLIHSG